MISRLSVLRGCWLLCVMWIMGTCQVWAQQAVPVIQWSKLYGGSEFDGLNTLQRTTDGGYILGGTSFSGVSGDKSEPSRGREDYWVIKVDAVGNKQWERTFGGDNWDWLLSVQQTRDGGYILGGYSESRVSGDRTAPVHIGVVGLPSSDYWLVKLDAQGNKEWDQSLGGNDGELFAAVQQTQDGGYIVGGKSYSGATGDRTQPSRGSSDYWVVKLDAQGRKQWDKAYGGNWEDALESLQQTQDGGYILGGSTMVGVSGDQTQPGRGSNDYWLVKLDAQGNKQWDRVYGGSANDIMRSVQQTQDGGYILGGYSDSNISGDKTQNHYGNNSGYNYDFWVVKTTATGDLQWEKTYGALAIEQPNVVRQTTDGGYVIGGVSTSDVSGDKTQPHKGKNDGYEFDFWLLKLTANGAKQWDLTFGGGGDDHLRSLLQTPDGGFILGGYSPSTTSPDKPQGGKGGADFWVLKIGAAPAPPVTIRGDSLLCPGRVLTLTAEAGATPLAYRWSIGAITPAITVSQAGVYTVEVTYSGGVTSTAQHTVRTIAAVPLPTSGLGSDTTLCDGTALVLRLPEPPAGVTYRWSDGSTGASLVVQRAGTYEVQIRSACEVRTVSRRVVYAPCLEIPNIITPNGDNANETFRIAGLGTASWHLALFNRWGSKVYETTKYQNEWGSGAPPGMYYYMLRQADGTAQYTGWLQVVR